MKGVDPSGLKKFSRHLLDCRTHSRQLPKELLELQDYLSQLTVYVERYNRIKDSLARQNIGLPAVRRQRRDDSCREIGFSVKEDVNGSSAVQIIEIRPPEQVIVISGNEVREKEEDEGDYARVISSPEGETVQDLASDDSEIGIYFIEHVKPVNFINVLQRELCTLGSLFPNVNDIIKEITREFDHFKVCCSCLKKISPLLPDILKELQELIKFVKKKRNESYIWPNDSDYLRKTREGSPRTFKKEARGVDEKKFRAETVGFLTICTNTPKIIEETEANISGEPAVRGKSEYIKTCSVRVSKRPQLTVLQPETQSDLRYIEKANTIEKETPSPKKTNNFGETFCLTEFSNAQVLRTLHPGPVLETTLQYRVGGQVECRAIETDAINKSDTRFVDLDDFSFDAEEEEFKKCLALKAREFLLTARVALGEVCLELESDNEKMEYEKELKADVKDLKDLMLEVHKNQIELSKVLLEKEVLNPAIVRLTDPEMLYEVKEGIRKAKNSLTEASSDNSTAEDLQCLVDELKSKCKTKNRLIMALLEGLSSDLSRHNWDELIGRTLQEAGSLKQLQAEEPSDFLKNNSLAEPATVLRCQSLTKKQLNVQEILSDNDAKQELGKNSAKISFSEIISKESKCLQIEQEFNVTGNESVSITKSYTMREFDVETEKLMKDLENEVNSLTLEQNKILCEIEGLRNQKSAKDQMDVSESATINLTIKIGEHDLRNRYQSALSVVPSGATLKEKKSQISLPISADEICRSSASSVQDFASTCYPKEEPIKKNDLVRKSFKSLALKLKLPILFRKERKLDGLSKGVVKLSEPKLEDYIPVLPDSGTVYISASELKESFSRCGNIPDFYFKKDMRRSHSSSEKISGSQSSNDLYDSDTSRLYPQMNIHCEQNHTIKKLRSRLRFLEDDLRSLKTTIDRMGILTEKLVDDACESFENFKDIYNRFRFISVSLNI